MPSTRKHYIAALTGLVISLLGPHVANAHERPSSSESATVAPLDACPVAGPNSFIDSWGDARSSGRRHEGVDMEADHATPVVAVRDGSAEFKRSNLGGNAIWLTAPTGERFYYAHLDDWAGESRVVQAGEVIGYVGQTGNARGDHLHFEARPGDTAVNAYPLVDIACGPSARLGLTPIPFRPLLR
ncbi:MAG: M23 family metallopeptidase [Ilumatobacteraceae bacterium]|nr:M23 family metallopeptidase [Ilumatobacteraceae bacterium]